MDGEEEEGGEEKIEGERRHKRKNGGIKWEESEVKRREMEGGRNERKKRREMEIEKEGIGERKRKREREREKKKRALVLSFLPFSPMLLSSLSTSSINTSGKNIK